MFALVVYLFVTNICNQSHCSDVVWSQTLLCCIWWLLAMGFGEYLWRLVDQWIHSCMHVLRNQPRIFAVLFADDFTVCSSLSSWSLQRTGIDSNNLTILVIFPRNNKRLSPRWEACVQWKPYIFWNQIKLFILKKKWS